MDAYRERLRSYIPRQYGTAKEAFSWLVEAAGGLESAAALTRVSKSRLHNYTDPAMPDCHAPLDVIEDLQKATGATAVLEYLALRAGCWLMPMIAAPGETGLAHDMARVGENASGLFAEFAEAIADDGVIDAAEASRLMKRGDEMAKAYMRMRQSLEEKIEQKAA